jgi:hypothetical protein
VLRIRIRSHWIHRIHMFLGLPDPDPIVRGMDPDPDPFIIMQNSKKNLDSYYFVTLFDFLSLKNDVMYLQKVTSRKNPHPLVRGMDPRIRIQIHPNMSWIRKTVPPSSLLKVVGNEK